jgi:segregation and condensation protein A
MVEHEEKLYTLITSQELTWEGLIRDIITREGLDPWDIDISLLTNRFVERIRELKKADLKISGKFILAAAILLKMKADFLMPRLLPETELVEKVPESLEYPEAELEPHIPIPKERKVTLDELLRALRSAMVVKERRTIRYKEREIKMAVKIKKIDVAERIKLLLQKISMFFNTLGLPEIKFSQLLHSKLRTDIIWTFIPLIHLSNKGAVKLRQEEDFGEIYVSRPGEGQGSD